jgi:hypothetical protein
MAFGVIPEETWHCNSTDEKPKDNVPDGQGLIEKDTGNIFLFDAEIKDWRKVG